jgi:hypothetical protein
MCDEDSDRRTMTSSRSIGLLIGCIIIGFVLVSLLVTLICAPYIYKRFRDLQPPPRANAVLDLDAFPWATISVFSLPVGDSP